MNTTAQQVQTQVVRYVANPGFTQAILVFTDSSRLFFEHSSRTNRWAKASAADSMADSCCQAIQQFRLNAKHLQLYFGDDSDLEFFTSSS
jgi:hypothetical protein